MYDFVLFLIQGIPECIGVTGLSMALAGIILRWERILTIGTVMAIIIYLIRLLPVTFGLHTVAALLLYALFIIRSSNAPATRVFTSVFASTAILLILETAVFDVFLFFTKMDPGSVISNKLLWQLLGMPHSFILIILAIIAARVKKLKALNVNS